ncbi:MAG: hypothetical protein ACK5NB_13705 [Flavobacteriaceae bacterium]
MKPKNKTSKAKLAFKMLEKEFKTLNKTEQQSFSGGNGPTGYDGPGVAIGDNVYNLLDEIIIYSSSSGTERLTITDAGALWATTSYGNGGKTWYEVMGFELDHGAVGQAMLNGAITAGAGNYITALLTGGSFTWVSAVVGGALGGHAEWSNQFSEWEQNILNNSSGSSGY